MRKIVFALSLLFCISLPAEEYTLELKVNKPDGIFKTGEKAVFSCRVLKDGNPVDGIDVRYFYSADNQNTVKGKFISGAAWTKEAVLNYPGWVRLGFSIQIGRAHV